jgi:MraZ protein
MLHFTSTLDGTFDAKKARLSVPAPFRTILSRLGAEAIVLRPSDHAPCIEVWPESVFRAEVQRVLGKLSPFSPKYHKFSRQLVGQAHTVTYDNEGRFGLPPALIAHARLEGPVKFAGSAEIFQIWAAPLLEANDAALAAEGDDDAEDFAALLAERRV